MSVNKWRFTALFAALVACFFIGDLGHNILGMFCDLSTKAAWFWHDLGNEVQNTAGLALAVLRMHEGPKTWRGRIAAHYVLSCTLVYALVDIVDQIFNDNARPIKSDLLIMAGVAAYGIVSLIIWRIWMKQNQPPGGSGNAYRIILPPNTITGIVPFLIRHKRQKRVYMDGVCYTKGKSVWAVSKHVPVKGEILRYYLPKREFDGMVNPGN